MNTKSKYTSLILLQFLFLGCTAAPDKSEDQAIPLSEFQAIETGYLEATPGYVGEVLGAEVTDTNTTGEKIDVVDITIPVDPDQVDEVRVISRAGKVVEQDKPAEVLRDYENNNVGIRLFLPKRKNWEFKLRLVDQTAER